MRDQGLYLLAALAACGGDSDEGAITGAGGANSASTSLASTSVTSSVVTTATTSGGVPFDCDPPADPGSFYELWDMLHYGGQTVSMCELRGEVLLAVNTAAI
jgi:hypothetical protein